MCGASFLGRNTPFWFQSLIFRFWHIDNQSCLYLDTKGPPWNLGLSTLCCVDSGKENATLGAAPYILVDCGLVILDLSVIDREATLDAVLLSLSPLMWNLD